MNSFTKTFAGFTIVSLLSSASWAQTVISEPDIIDTPNIENESDEVDIVTTTGTRLRGGAASEPVTTINSEEIVRRGIESIDQLFRQLSANNAGVSLSATSSINGPLSNNRGQVIPNLEGGTVADLRGLGAGSTLVLLNGRRIAGEGTSNGDFADISGIPIEAIERIDILTAGASAIYGADAVAGVINIILKKDFSDTTIRARAGFSESGADDYRLSFTSGHNWNNNLGGGNITITGSYQTQDAVNAREFGVTTRDFRDRGGDDRRILTSRQGVFFLSEGAPVPNDVFASNGLVLPFGSGPVTAATDVSTFLVVPRDDIDEVLPVNLTPEFDVFAGSLRIDQDVPWGFVNNIFADASYSRRTTETEVEAPLINVSSFSFNAIPGGLPFPSPTPSFFQPFRTDIQYSFDTTDLVDAGLIANRRFDTRSENINLAAGIKGDITKDWSWEGSVSFSQDENFNVVEDLDLAELISGTFDFTTFTFVGATNLIRNDFLDNAEIGQTLANTFETNVFESQTNLLTFNGFTTGSLFTGREAGPLGLVFGGEYRNETIDNFATITTIDEDITTIPNLDAIRETFALFAEANFPIIESLIINAAIRWEDIENTGTSVTQEDALAAFVASGGAFQFEPIDVLSDYRQSDSGFSPRIGASWTPTDFLALRATYGQSFRAPNAAEVGTASTAQPLFSPFSPDPSFFSDPISGEVLDRLEQPQLSGGNPNLESEVAETLNLGAKLDFSIAENSFSLDVGYFQIDYKDRIVSSFEFLANDFSATPLREPAVVRDDDGGVAFIFNGPINVANQDTAGVDIAATHETEVLGWNWDTLLNYSVITKNETQALASEPIEDFLGIDSPETRWNLRSTIQKGGLSITGIVRHTGGFESSAFEGDIDSLTTADLNLSYIFGNEENILNGVRLAIGATNLFDTDPQFVNFGNGFSTNSYDLRRRVVSFEVSKRF